MNYCDLLFNTDTKSFDLEALIDAENGSRLTYGELINEVRKTAEYLRNKGYKPGTVVSTHLYNSIDAAVILLAIQYIGGVVCLVDPLYKAGELIYYLQDSGSKCLITYLEEKDIQAELKDGNEIDADIINIEAYHKELADITCGSDNEGCYNYEENELAMLLYTSGTSSKPKGVMLTTGCFYTFVDKSNSSMYTYIPEDRILCFVPFSHGFGSLSILIPALCGKAAIVFLRAFQPVKISKTIISENITHIFGVPTHYQQLLRYESIYDSLRKLKAAFSAAAPLSYETALAWYKATGIYLDEGYGMTETTTLIATRMSMLPEPTGNVGFPPKGILEVEAVDEDSNVCEDGIIGELRVSGRGIMLGYLNKPMETQERLRDGKVYTGDYGYRRSDGSFVLCGRKTEFINVAGLKISPLEIEAVLNSHKDVVDSAAVGIEDEIYGQIVKAFVVLKDNAPCNERDLIKYISGKIANFKVPKYISVLEEFPRNNLGKIDKNALKSF
ncbi:class I adenylate-forming enzyme family protein [Pseudobacteroides cellulosolvens]|uniref:O-succinylbenzoate--CoA ligase n=1 Tax=Pseudobacteroides cellulosolvens ATCC 35603 = DSM 2933 TaxID=398512 RepID=A0A0L6JME3_9FIRM|nr:class I adenylate-forming enzyme family protein [Pseudobacteroides cellulosolvens]KNY26966.1 o-succinylbenzoate--CoA ligase [Pseudobacteroides cellulosolvens ATCC 35603 = DSM 2933]